MGQDLGRQSPLWVPDGAWYLYVFKRLLSNCEKIDFKRLIGLSYDTFNIQRLDIYLRLKTVTYQN